MKNVKICSDVTANVLPKGSLSTPKNRGEVYRKVSKEDINRLAPVLRRLAEYDKRK